MASIENVSGAGTAAELTLVANTVAARPNRCRLSPRSHDQQTIVPAPAAWMVERQRVGLSGASPRHGESRPGTKVPVPSTGPGERDGAIDMVEKKSDDHFVDIPVGISKPQMIAVVEAAAPRAGLYISHIGSFSRTKYPNSMHWHFKRHSDEAGVLDATFWDVKSMFWLMVRHREPPWVHRQYPLLLKELRRELKVVER